MTMIVCNLCDGSGMALTSTCPRCDGLGKIAERIKRVLPSAPHGRTFFRGALVSQNPNSKGTKR